MESVDSLDNQLSGPKRPPEKTGQHLTAIRRSHTPMLAMEEREVSAADETPVGQLEPGTGTKDGEAWENLARQSRLSLPSAIRIPVVSFTSFAVGMGLGLVQGSKMAGLRFRAEHAHKLPTTAVGWYMYHKSKNYNVAFGGVREGLKMGAKVSVWTAGLLLTEAWWDYYRDTADIANTLAASVTVAGAFSVWNRLSFPMAARTTKTAIVIGLVYGGLQDLAGALRGRNIGYIELLKRQLRIRDTKSQEPDVRIQP